MNGPTVATAFKLLVGENGDFPTEGAFSVSRAQGGCPDPHCREPEHETGHWITLMLPVNDDGEVFGATLAFGDREDLVHFCTKLHQVTGHYLKNL